MRKLKFSDKDKEENDGQKPDDFRQFLSPQVIQGLNRILPGRRWKKLKKIESPKHSIYARRTENNLQIGLWVDDHAPDNQPGPTCAISVSYTNAGIGNNLKSWLDIPPYEYEDPIEQENGNEGAPIFASMPENSRVIKIRNINRVPSTEWFVHVNKAWFDPDNDTEHWPKFVNEERLRWRAPEFPREIPIEGENGEPRLALDHVDNEMAESWAKGFLGVAALRLVNKFFLDNSEEAKPYIPQIPVYLTREKVQELATNHANDQGEPDPLTYADATIDAACAALMAGKHLILIGPPGCGKSKLAEILTEAAGFKPLTVTASPHWSTDEVIGRYLPDPKSKTGGITFSEGHFLKAINSNRWLIVDEINRTEIDDCFGELFTVLSGQKATLSFKAASSGDSEEQDGLEWRSIQILPKPRDQVDDDPFENYVVKREFRMIATMNDKDAARLFRLSYALQRRFATVHIPSMTPQQMWGMLSTHVKTRLTYYGNDENGLNLPGNLQGNNPNTVENVIKPFIVVGDEGNLRFTEYARIMVERGVLSPAIAKDMIDLLLATLATERGGQLNNLGQGNAAQNRRQQILRSCFLSSMRMSLLPQLRSLLGAGDQKDQEDLCRVIRGLRDFFGQGGDNYSAFVTVDTNGDWEAHEPMNDVLNGALQELFRDTMFDLECSQEQLA